MIESLTRALPDRRPRRRRAGFAAGAAGLAAMLGAGAGLISGCSHDGDASAARDSAATAGLPTPAASSIVAGAARSPASSAQPAATASAPASTSSRRASPRPSATGKVDDEITAARKKAAKEGHPLQRALTAKGETAAKERTETTSEGTVKVITAKGDLTGQRELLMAADRGEPVGRARCTQRLRFANASTARVLPTVLLCWRVSAERSVVTFAVAKQGKPSPELSESIINREWAML